MMYVLISAYMLKQRKTHAYRPQPREQQPRAGAVVAEGALVHWCDDMPALYHMAAAGCFTIHHQVLNFLLSQIYA